MTDNQLIKLFRPIVVAGLAALGYSSVGVVQNNQPTVQGAATGPTVYFYKIGDKRYGFLERSDAYNSEDNDFVHTETQKYETTFQVSALVRQDPAVTTSYTASDLVNAVAMILASDAARETMLAAGVGILRVMDVRNPYFLDDHDQFEASPSFDFVLTYDRTIQTTVPVVESVMPGIYGI
jgi:hypothetical protein